MTTQESCDRPRYRAHLSAVRDLGFPTPAGATILDFGCGSDCTIKSLLAEGYDAYGCDLAIPDDQRELAAAGRLRAIEREPYRLPFDNDSFDLVLSNQVFEHVQNYPAAIAEIARILKSTGASLHVFPSRYAPIEPHAKVPLATILRHPTWLRLWALLGIRNQFQTELPPMAVAKRNHEYLESQTNYLPKRELLRLFRERFRNVEFCLEVYLSHYPDRRFNRLYRILRRVPFSFRLAETFSTRVVLLSDPATF